VSFDAATELSAGQLAQPQQQQQQQQLVSLEDDFFPATSPASPIPRRNIVQQRASFNGLSVRNDVINSRPGSLTSPSSNGAQIRSNGLSRRSSFRSPISTGCSKPVSTPKSPLNSDQVSTLFLYIYVEMRKLNFEFLCCTGWQKINEMFRNRALRLMGTFKLQM
jgi:hypothetical protein